MLIFGIHNSFATLSNINAERKNAKEHQFQLMGTGCNPTTDHPVVSRDQRIGCTKKTRSADPEFQAQDLFLLGLERNRFCASNA
jgi:hypothetical protein